MPTFNSRPDRLQQIFAHNLREVRGTLGISQVELSRRTEIARPYISDIECGKVSPTLNLVDRFAEALGVEPFILLLPESPLKRNSA